MMGNEGEKAEINQTAPTLGELADIRMALKIWDVPPELGRKFIGTAKSSYANKSWLLLQDLMMKADKYDLLVSSGRIDQLEARMGIIEKALLDIHDALKEQETANEPKVFGGNKDG